MLFNLGLFRVLFSVALIVSCYGFLKDVSGLPSTWLPNDKVMHLLIFMVLMLFWQLSFQERMLQGVLLLGFYGGAIEVLQHYATVRTGDGWDWLADLIGIGIACLLWQIRPITKLPKS